MRQVLLVVASIASVLAGSTVSVAAPVGSAKTAVSVHEVLTTPPIITHLEDVSCPSANVCYLASKPLEKTIDGGQTWVTVKTNPYDVSGLSAIDCPTDDMCLGVDPLGTLFRMSDGGAVWTQGQTPAPIFATRIACFSTTFCVAAGRVGATAALGTTYDAGATWAVQQFATESPSFEAIECASALFCVVVGDHVGISTHDGGATWDVESTFASDYFRDVDCMSSTTCLAVSWADAVWTDTAGSSWSTTPGAGGSAMACGIASCAVFPVGPTATGYVWVPPPGSPTNSTLPANLGRVEHASCAGATCLTIGSSTPGSPAIPLGISGTPLSSAAILRTIDAGVSWGRIASPPPADFYSDLDCVSASTCVVLGNSGTLQRTVDGGTSWSPVASPFAQVTHVACQPSGHCVIVGVTAVDTPQITATSTDSGASWSLSAPLPVFENPVFGEIPVSIFDITCADSDVCYAMGGVVNPLIHLPFFDAALLKSTNGGSSWATLDTFPAGGPGKVACSSATNCLASTGAGVLFSPPSRLWRTADGGTSWQAVEFSTTPDSVGLLGCSSGRCFVDLDGPGGSTSQVSADTGLTWADVTRVSGENGALACAGTTCLRTHGSAQPSLLASDAWGASWDEGPIPLPLSRFVRTECPDENTCFAIGTGGSALGTTIIRLDLQPRPLASFAPARLLDTRPGMVTVDHLFEGGGALVGGSVLELQVAGRGGVAADALSAVLNVTVTEPVAAGFVSVFPCGEPQPLASNVNFVAGATVANAVISKLGAGGRVCLFSNATTQLIVDVGGYVPVVSASIAGVVPARLLETRAGPGMSTVDHLFEGAGKAPAGSVVEVQVAGRGGLPVDASSAVLNVTVTEPDGAGFVTVFPCGEPQPLASSVNYVAGATVANAVISKLGADGRACLFTLAATHLVVDVSGFVPAGVSSVVGVAPARVLETRSGPGFVTVDHLFEGGGVVAAGATVELAISGRAGVPGDAASVMLNVTVTEPAAAGYVTVYPCDKPRPNTSTVNYVAGATTANSAITKIGAQGSVCLYSYAPVHLVVDATGYAL